MDPRDGTVWEHEHGPKGGDEINRLRPGLNYGWPRTTHGVDYSGELISTEQTAQGHRAAAAGLGALDRAVGVRTVPGRPRFPDWTGDFFVGGLAERSLHRVRMRNGEVVLQETMLRELNARIRDVRTGPDGLLYLLTDDANGSVLRLRPTGRTGG